MKKFLSFYLPLFFIFIAVGVFTLRYLNENHENVLKCLAGAGKIVSPAKNAVIKMDGIESADTKIFESNGRFYVVTDDRRLREDMLIIDKSENDVALPNGGCRELILSNYLFLADCGYGGVFYSDGKADKFNTQLKMTDSEISFVIPAHKIEILFKGE